MEVAAAWENWNWGGFWIAVGISFIVAIFIGSICGYDSYSWESFWTVFFFTFLLGAAMFGTIVGLVSRKPIAYETHYKVITDDSVTMSDFLDKYEIVDQEGKIYTVREKE